MLKTLHQWHLKHIQRGGNTLANQIKTASTKSLPLKENILGFIDSQINGQNWHQISCMEAVKRMDRTTK